MRSWNVLLVSLLGGILLIFSGISTATAIWAETGYTCAVFSDGTVKCWGTNNYDKLGNGTTTDSPTSVTVSGIP